MSDLTTEARALLEGIDEPAVNYALANLRHLYAQMLDGHIRDTVSAARGLLGPSIENVERHVEALASAPSLVRRLVEENERLEKELAFLRQATTRVVELDETNCPHNDAVDPDTGECLVCGTVLP